jgi:hypothetical protein
LSPSLEIISGVFTIRGASVSIIQLAQGVDGENVLPPRPSSPRLRLTSFGKPLIASEYLRAEELRCFEMNAHFAVATLLMSRLELTIQIHLMRRSGEVRKLPYYRARSKRRGYVKVIGSLKLHELFALARAIGLFSMVQLADHSLDVVASFGYPKDTNGALKYLRERRNELHPAVLAKSVPKILRDLPVDPAGAFEDFYFNYAAVAIQVLGGVTDQPENPDQRFLHHI